MIFLQKPGKTGCEPKHWRPIALQDGLGKSVISVVSDQARPCFSSSLSVRISLTDRRLRLFGVCFNTVTRCGRCVWNKHRTCTPRRPGPHSSLRRPRQHLAHALYLALVPEDVQTVLLAWLDQATYKFEHKRLEGRLVLSREALLESVMNSLSFKTSIGDNGAKILGL